MVAKNLDTLYQLREAYIKQGYHFAGIQSCVKPCYWMKKSLRTRGRSFCYKQLWYSIPSHRCLQMTPTILCNLQCIYCWRAHEIDLGLKPITNYEKVEFDEPRDIVVNTVIEWRKILSGFRGHPEVEPRMFEEAIHPIHVTLSLTGEPLIYPRVGELVEEYFKYGFKSVFIVTNGTFPERLYSLSREPSQLYVTLPAPNEKLFKLVCRPLIPNAWQKLTDTIEGLSTLKCPTVIRLTMVKGYNMIKPEEYAKIINLGEPTYVEVKAAMDVGYFRKRLGKENMPRYVDIVEFAHAIADNLGGYKIIGCYLPSRVVLISKLEKPLKIIVD